MPARPKKRTREQSQEEADAQQCSQALRLREAIERDDIAVQFGSDGSYLDIYTFGAAEAAAFEPEADPFVWTTDGGDQVFNVPTRLYRGSFEDPPIQWVTIGDGRDLVAGKTKPFYVLDEHNDFVDYSLLEPTDAIFQGMSVMAVEIAEPEAYGDSRVYEYGGSCWRLAKVTAELKTWSREVVRSVELLASRASREMIYKLHVRMHGVMDIHFFDGGEYDAWRESARELGTKMEEIKKQGMHSRKAEWCKLHVKQLKYRQKMEMQRALADADAAAVLDDWHSLRWRLLWKTMRAYQQQRTFTGPTLKLSKWGLVW